MLNVHHPKGKNPLQPDNASAKWGVLLRYEPESEEPEYCDRNDPKSGKDRDCKYWGSFFHTNIIRTRCVSG
jgi:hypothetical protein